MIGLDPWSKATGKSLLQSAPLDSLKIESEKKSSLEQLLSGKAYSFVFYFASWCTFCRSEVAQLKKIHAEFPASLGLIGISGDERESELKKVPQDWGLDWPLFWDSTHEFKKIHEIHKIPTLYFVNSEGEILEQHVSTYHLKEFFQKTREKLAKNEK